MESQQVGKIHIPVFHESSSVNVMFTDAGKEVIQLMKTINARMESKTFEVNDVAMMNVVAIAMGHLTAYAAGIAALDLEYQRLCAEKAQDRKPGAALATASASASDLPLKTI